MCIRDSLRLESTPTGRRRAVRWTWRAMSGSGAAMSTSSRRGVVTWETARGWCVAVPGSASPAAAVPPSATGSPPASATSIWVFGCVARPPSIEPLTSESLISVLWVWRGHSGARSAPPKLPVFNPILRFPRPASILGKPAFAGGAVCGARGWCVAVPGSTTPTTAVPPCMAGRRAIDGVCSIAR